MASKTIQVENISQYLAAITENGLDDCVSRGEAKKYKAIDSTAFRLDDPGKFKGMVKRYFDIVGNGLTPMQEKHFLAFSQHHGIPTNLIDFTDRHLVSLFFACHDTEKNAGGRGYVKFIKNDRLIHCNDLIAKFEHGKSLLNEILEFNETTVSFANNAAAMHERESSYIVYHFFELAELLKEINKDALLEEEKVFDEFFALVEKYKDDILRKDLNVRFSLTNYSIFTYSEFLRPLYAACTNTFAKPNTAIRGKEAAGILSYFDHVDAMVDEVDEVDLYLFLLRIVFREACGVNYNENKIELPFYLAYTPPNIDNRIISQSSIFIHQLFYDVFYDCGDLFVREPHLHWKQTIIPDFEIVVTNKKAVLSQLDKLGVNLMTIYNDYDSIAKYIKDSASRNT